MPSSDRRPGAERSIPSTRSPLRRRAPLARRGTEKRAPEGAGQLVLAAARHASGWLGLLAAGYAIATAAELMLPAALGAAVDSAVSHRTSAGPLAWLGVVLAGSACSDALVNIAQAGSGARAVAWLRRGLIRHLLGIGAGLGSQFAGGDLVGRFVDGTENTAEAPRTAINIAVSVARGAGAVVALWLIYWPLAVAFVLGLPGIAFLLSVLVRRTSGISTRYQELTGLISARFMDALGGVKTIRATGTQRREIERILAPLPALREHGLEMWRVNANAAWLGALLMPFIMMVVLTLAGFGVSAGRLAPGQIIAASGYALLGLSVLGQSGMLVRLGRNRAGAGRVAEVFAAAPLRNGHDGGEAGAGQLVLRDVSVDIGATAILRDANLTIPAGAVVAVVGRSGAGKSMLASVAGRLIDPDRGEVFLDGVPLASLTPTALRDAVAYAFERPVLFGETVADAIDAAHGGLDMERVRAAARTAGIDAFIRRLPAQYATPLRDLRMSGGERQRLGLARAVAQGGRLLILDDATSSLDMVTEGQISAALSGAHPGCTQIVVAHRASTAARASLVAWLDGGRVRALAPHDVLWASECYRRVFAHDQQPAGDGAPPDAGGTAVRDSAPAEGA